MHVFEFVIIIVSIVMITGLIKSRMNARDRTSEEGSLEDKLTELGVTEQLKRIDQLEQRIRTLEKIVTDKSSSLAEEIDRL